METEIKIEVTDLEQVRERLRQAGGRLVGIADEENRYFERSRKGKGRTQMLRLRRDERSRLTWKGATAFDAGVRSRTELEVEVSDFDTMADILRRLGFLETERLVKRRETWHLQEVEVVLDTLAFGQFVELEGEPDATRRVAVLLGLDPSQGLARSYREIAEDRERSLTLGEGETQLSCE